MLKQHKIVRNLSKKNPNFENIKTVGVFVNETVENLLKIAEEVKLDVIQLHGDEDESFIQILKRTV